MSTTLKDEGLERLTSLAKSISGDYDLIVLPGNPGEEWFFNPATNEIYYDPLDLEEKGIEFCLGLIVHESAHKKITRLDLISDELWNKPGFALLFNCIESE